MKPDAFQSSTCRMTVNPGLAARLRELPDRIEAGDEHSKALQDKRCKPDA